MKSLKRPSEFKALELRVSEDASAPHIIYFKEHSIRGQSDDKPSGRTLFAVNIPPYADEKGLANAFREAGTVSSVLFFEKPCQTTVNKTTKFIEQSNKFTFKVAYLVFDTVASLEKALGLSKLQPMNCNGHEVKTGLKKWIEEYNKQVYQPKELKQKIELFMQQHDKDQKAAEKKEKKLEQEDDEGWITVTKRGKVQSFARSEKVENKILVKEEKGKKRKELKNFYTFQIRESKMKHIIALRQKFEEDKKKIEQIKQSRRFKPF